MRFYVTGKIWIELHRAFRISFLNNVATGHFVFKINIRREFWFKIYSENMIIVIQYFKDFYHLKLIKLILYKRIYNVLFVSKIWSILAFFIVFDLFTYAVMLKILNLFILYNFIIILLMNERDLLKFLEIQCCLIIIIFLG